jgi:DNA-binding MarR family transcriptional regulator
VRPEDTGFSQTEYNESFIIFNSTYVRPKQNEIEKVFNYLLGFNGYAIRITPIDPPSYNFSEATLLQIASKDELRKMAGLPEVTVRTLDTLSPLVANKVLESMTKNELRDLINLKGIVEIPEEAKFEKQDELLILFDSVGASKNAYELIRHKQFHFDNDTQLNQIEKELMFDSLSDNVLALLKDTDSTIKDIANTLGVSEKEITAVIKKLETKGEIKVSKGIVSTTPKGTKIAENKPAFPEMSVRYSYELEPFAPALKAGGESRPFCDKLMTMDKLYTREEIDRISSIVGYSVWLTRGGWYHNPTKDVNTPYCRHIWQAGVYIKK